MMSDKQNDASRTLFLAPRSISFVKGARDSIESDSINDSNPSILQSRSISTSSKRDPSTHANHNLPLPRPEWWFFNPNMLPKLRQISPGAVGCGLNNPGLNICFMNATLQALTYAPGMCDDMLKAKHSKKCPHRPLRTFCALCKFEEQIRAVLSQPKGAISNQIYMWVKRLIWKNYRIGKQEDAHEFLRFFMESLNKSCLPLDFQTSLAQNKLREADWMTTYISQLFGGWLKNSILCKGCGYRSNKYDSCLDFLVEISASSSIENALSRFVRPEYLTGGNRYMCPVCEEKQDAIKKLVIHKAPRLLTIPLKRFGFTFELNAVKCTRPIEFPMTLNMEPFIHPTDPELKKLEYYIYDLWAIVCHLGNSLRSGHYVTYAKALNNLWYYFDDECVKQTKESQVLNQKQAAYILFYARRGDVTDIKTSEISKFSPSNMKSNNTVEMDTVSTIDSRKNINSSYTNNYNQSSGTTLAQKFKNQHSIKNCKQSLENNETKNNIRLINKEKLRYLSDSSNSNHNHSQKFYKESASKYFTISGNSKNSCSNQSINSQSNSSCLSISSSNSSAASQTKEYRKTLVPVKIMGYSKRPLSTKNLRRKLILKKLVRIGSKPQKDLIENECPGSRTKENDSIPSHLTSSTTETSESAPIHNTEAEGNFKAGARIRISNSTKSQFGVTKVQNWGDKETKNYDQSEKGINFHNTQGNVIVKINKRSAYEKEYDKGRRKKFKNRKAHYDAAIKTSNFFKAHKDEIMRAKLKNRVKMKKKNRT